MADVPIALPPGLDEQRGLGPEWGVWLDRLPRLFAELLDEWELSRDGDELWYGFCSLVAPVLTDDGEPAVLKISFDGDDESLHEALALQHWRGRGTVRLLRADPHRRAFLLERLDRRDLTDVWDLEACEIVAGLYPALHLPALPQLATVTSYVDRWLEALATQPRDIPIPLRYREQALSLGRDLVAAPAGVGRIIHGDLHYENVLAAPPGLDPERGAWLVIDPKPMSGDPHYELAPMLWNRYDELGGDVRGGLRRRFHTLVDAAGLDEDRARDWVVVRMVLNANWSVEDAQRAGRDLDAEERAWITRCIAIAKAVQD
jgi:streptomycin 6-kinase